MPFRKGQSGNPNGRPKGIADKRSELAGLLTPYAPALVKKAVELALDGDVNALRLCLERLIPKAKDEKNDIEYFGTINVQELTDEELETIINGDYQS